MTEYHRVRIRVRIDYNGKQHRRPRGMECDRRVRRDGAVPCGLPCPILHRNAGTTDNEPLGGKAIHTCTDRGGRSSVSPTWEIGLRGRPLPRLPEGPDVAPATCPQCTKHTNAPPWWRGAVCLAKRR